MKIVLIGAGSFVFSLSVLHDLIVDHRLADGELALVDVNAEVLPIMAGVGERMRAETGSRLEIQTATDRAEALPGADFVILAAEIEGARRWRMDYDIALKHGLADQGRECGGLGGLLHALRSGTLALAVARDMERLCPGAMLLDVTNPMPRVVGAVAKHSRVAVAGFCNVAWGGYPGYQWLASLAGRSAAQIDVVTAGLNHFAWLLSIRDRQSGEDLTPRVLEAIGRAPDGEARLLRRWHERYGALGVSSPQHMAELLPFDPEVRYCDRPPFHGSPEERRRLLERLRAVAAGEAPWRDALTQRSWERPVDLAVALARATDADFDTINMANDGFIRELPPGRIVEVPARARAGRLAGVAVSALAPPLAELLGAVSDVIDASADAIALGGWERVQEVIELDPAIGDKKNAVRAAAEMLRAHADLLNMELF